ncbi:MAG: ADP-ribosylglycohydrolase family protein [Acholeplasmatales bacterium]|jgi:type I restriction enzyme M protein|nr:ADP-ribosylglycohydrolase family protein [Acholeplasmatales bacterium]
MLGAIVGDVVGSIYEWHNIKTKKFDFLSQRCFFTDDTVMSVSVAKSLLECKKDFSNLSEVTICNMRFLGNKYPNAGYGGMFRQWLYNNDLGPYNSYGNGAAMRVSACAWVAKTLKEALNLSQAVTSVTHNHIEGIKGAAATVACIFLARNGKTIKEIKNYIDENYYKMDFTLDDIRDSYSFNESCEKTVPQAIVAFLESISFEDAIRNAISIGGDSDTLAAITGSIAEAYYGIPISIRDEVIKKLDKSLLEIVTKFESKYPPKITSSN